MSNILRHHAFVLAQFDLYSVHLIVNTYYAFKSIKAIKKVVSFFKLKKNDNEWIRNNYLYNIKLTYTPYILHSRFQSLQYAWLYIYILCMHLYNNNSIWWIVHIMYIYICINVKRESTLVVNYNPKLAEHVLCSIPAESFLFTNYSYMRVYRIYK